MFTILNFLGNRYCLQCHLSSLWLHNGQPQYLTCQRTWLDRPDLARWAYKVVIGPVLIWIIRRAA